MNELRESYTNPPNRLVPGKYVVVHECTCRRYEVDAVGPYNAALKAAEKAHQEWAWEATWPLTFTVTRPDGKVFEVEVDRETRPEFHVGRCKEKSCSPTKNPELPLKLT